MTSSTAEPSTPLTPDRNTMQEMMIVGSSPKGIMDFQQEEDPRNMLPPLSTITNNSHTNDTLNHDRVPILNLKPRYGETSPNHWSLFSDDHSQENQPAQDASQPFHGLLSKYHILEVPVPAIPNTLMFPMDF